MDRVLIVEDDQTLSDLYAEQMRGRGLTVDQAGTVATAMAMFEAHPPAVACVDGRLPDGSGAEVAREFGLRGAKVIFITNDQRLYEEPPTAVALAVLKINVTPGALAAAVKGFLITPETAPA